MKDKTYLNKSREYLSNGRIQDCLDILKENINDDDILNQVLQLEIRYNTLKRRLNGGTLDINDAQLEENRISNSLLFIISNIAKGKKSFIPKPSQKKPFDVKWIIIGLLGLSLLGLGYFVLSNPDRNAAEKTDPCENIRCLNEGVCNNGTCDCPSGYTGNRCQTKINPENPCQNITCLNGGVCRDGNCDCPSGYTGSRCQTKVSPANPCQNISCLNGGVCRDGNCDCPSGYTGDRCQTRITETTLREDCLNFNYNAIRVKKEGDKYLLTDGNSRMMIFRTEKAANLAVNTIKKYRLNKHCFAVRPDPGLKYFLSGANIPSGSIAGEDCLKISSPDNLRIKQRGNNSFSIIDTGGGTPYSAKSREEAEKIIAIVKKYNAKYTCYISRPSPGMVYLRK